MWRGFRKRCPSCGEGPIFSGYIKQTETCPNCGETLGEFRADDGPAYFTILIVGHIIVAAMLIVELRYHPSMLVHLSLWIPLTLILSFVLLPPIKGALIGLQWAHKAGL